MRLPLDIRYKIETAVCFIREMREGQRIVGLDPLWLECIEGALEKADELHRKCFELKYIRHKNTVQISIMIYASQKTVETKISELFWLIALHAASRGLIHI